MLAIAGCIPLLKSAGFLLTGIAGVGFIIAFHELGHFLFCKMFKVHVPSFSIGMGPMIFKKKLWGTQFGLSAIPLGGYVEMVQRDDSSGDKEYEGQYFDDKPYYQKILIMCGGIIFNLIFSYTVFTALFATGIPETPVLYPGKAAPIIGSVREYGQQYDFHAGDKIVAVNGVSTKNKITEFKKLIEPLAGKPATLTIDRDKKTIDIHMTIGTSDNSEKPVGMVGINFDSVNILPPMSLLKSIKEGANATWLTMKMTFGILGNMFKSRNIGDNMASPFMIIAQTMKDAQRGAKIFFMLLAFISVSTAILNLLPIPTIMDGGQMLTTTIETLIGRKMPEKALEYIHYACWILLMLLAAYLSVKDLIKIFGWFK